METLGHGLLADVVQHHNAVPIETHPELVDQVMLDINRYRRMGTADVECLFECSKICWSTVTDDEMSKQKASHWHYNRTVAK
jgi:predicted glycoside hydrolase/deacetylase ChbG (UPF0249 family)